ncbi:pyridine nucleotide-disulfide oxidoreductase-like protein [Thozetella sp. PMI_491]|nr:pyridine nucleotide-disulfide oxidoreductase-like protein [Thozetella sp. PMI_491]
MTSDLQNDAVNATTPFRILVIGGCYAGLSAALNLHDLCNGRRPRCGPPPKEDEEFTPPPPIAIDVTIVEERDGFYHLIGSPLALAEESYAEKAWVEFEDVKSLHVPSIHTVQGTVQDVNPETKVATVVTAAGTVSKYCYDFLVAASGLRRVWPVVPQSLRRKQYLFEAGDHIRNVTNSQHGVAIVGGGAVGIEMAAELKLVQPHTKVTLVHSRERLLSSEPLPDDCKDRALELVKESGVEMLLSHRLEGTEEVTAEDGTKTQRLKFTNGHSMLADHVVMAISKSIPSTTFLPKENLDAEGYIKVQPSLAFSPGTPNAGDHFAAGDAALWSGIKRCGAAMHQGYYAANNIHQIMNQRLFGTAPVFLELAEVPPMIGLAVGKKAVAYWPQEGTTYGVDVMKAFFGDDLGFTICWNHLGLGKSSL